jgi:adenylylsulfate kinase-like enzyme
MSGKLIYITGLSGSGKTTISKELQKLIPNSILLDGDEIRNTINKDIGYDRESKIKNISRNNELISLLYNQGFTIIAAFMASVSSERDKIFTMCNNNVKIQLTTPIDVCIERDPKGLYSKNLNNFFIILN